MSEETRFSRSTGHQDVSEIHLKLDSLIKHWADAAEMTQIMESCRKTVLEAHGATYELLTKVSQQLSLLLTPIEEPAPSRWRALPVLLAGASLLLSFGLGSLAAPWLQGHGAEVRQLEGFVADVHSTLERVYSTVPKGVQEQFQALYRQHQYAPLQGRPQEKQP